MKITSGEFLKSKWFLVLGLVLVTYTFIVLGKMVWQNYQINQQIKNLEKEVAAIEADNQKLSDLVSFFQTEDFKEKEAREKLGMVKPGEKVLVFPGIDSNEVSILEDDTGQKKEEEKKLSNIQKWWKFFFNKNN